MKAMNEYEEYLLLYGKRIEYEAKNIESSYNNFESQKINEVETYTNELFLKEDYFDPFVFREIMTAHYSKLRELMVYHDKIIYWSKKLQRFSQKSKELMIDKAKKIIDFSKLARSQSLVHTVVPDDFNTSFYGNSFYTNRPSIMPNHNQSKIEEEQKHTPDDQFMAFDNEMT